MTLQTLLIKLGKQFPKTLAEPFDFVGYQCGPAKKDKEINRVFLCLDYSEYCQKECSVFHPDIIITHHPFYFGRKEKIRISDKKKAVLEDSLSCPIYSYHTNFDKAENGMNDTLLDYLGWKKESVLKDGMTRTALLSKITSTKDIASYLLTKFPFKALPYYDFGKEVKRIGLLAGGGGNEFRTAMDSNVDLYISGDVSHHSRLDMYRYQFNYIELPHECEEIGFLLGMKKALQKINADFIIDAFAYEKYFSLSF